MIKIAVVGAGIGGVVCAYYLAQNGYDVTVYERASYDTVTYSWHDDIAKDAFEKAGLPFPPKELYFDKRNWTFVAPFSDKHVYADLPEPTDISIERRGFLHWLVGMAKKEGASFVWETSASLWVEQDAVKGLIVGEENVPYALVVDCTGLSAPLRKALPAMANIPAEIPEEEVFCAWRGFYRPNPDVEVEDHETNRAYLRHLGGKGISWCLADPTQSTVDVLIGCTGDMSPEVRDELFADLQKDNPILSDQLVSAGQFNRIPIRRPLPMLVWDGYAVLGDAACMTIPMLGSGMAASMMAGKILAQTVLDRQSVSKEALWHYQVAFYREVGAQFFGVDVMKRWLLSADPDDVRWLFESGVLDDKNIQDGAAGRNVHLSVGEMLKKLGKGYKRIGLLLSLSKVLQQGDKGVKLAMAIPTVYDADKIAAWRARLAKMYGGE